MASDHAWGKETFIPLLSTIALDPGDYLYAEIGMIFLEKPEEFLRRRRDTLLYIKRAERVMSKTRLFSMDLSDFLDDPEDADEEVEELFSATSDTAAMLNTSLES